jgi:hypothetical protein
MFFKQKISTTPEVIPQSPKLKAQVNLGSLTLLHKWGNCAKSCARRSCVSELGVMEVPVYVCLRRNCSYISEAVRFVRLILKVVVQNDRTFVGLILLYSPSRT